MSEDYYKILGIKKGASDAEIQRAYREMARKYHPDLNPDDAKAKEKFQAVQQAYEILNDSEQRELYDRYGSSFDKMGGHPGASPAGGFRGGGGFSGGEVNLDDLLNGQFGGAGGAGGGFADIFRHFAGGAAAQTRPQTTAGSHLNYQLEISFQTAVKGGEARITVNRQSGKSETIDVRIPAGIDDGKKIRLRGQGEPSPNGGDPGDILITVRAAPHPSFERRGKNLEVRVPITLKEAVQGATIDVPTPKGEISLKIPPGTSSGKKLRVKGFGVPSKDGDGDLYAEIQIVLPEDIPADIVTAIGDLKIGPDAPRSDLRW